MSAFYGISTKVNMPENPTNQQMNVQHSLIQELMLYKFRLDHNIEEVSKNICYAKGKGTVDHSTVTRWFQKFYLVARTLTITQGQVDLKQWIPRQRKKKASKAAELCLIFPEYSKTFDLL